MKIRILKEIIWEWVGISLMGCSTVIIVEEKYL